MISRYYIFSFFFLYFNIYYCDYRYAKMVNIIFNQVLFIQFCGSILVLCTCVYYLSSHITEFESATLIIYTFGMFVQIYVYCWSGNEVILKVSNCFVFYNLF